MIYFIHDPAAEAVKIGRSDDVERRPPGVQTGNPNVLTLLGTLPGGAPEEARLHEHFECHHRRGEWFDAPPAALDAIRRLLLAGGTPQTVADELRRRNQCRIGLKGVPVVILGEPETPFVIASTRWGPRRELFLDLFPPGAKEAVVGCEPRPGRRGAVIFVASELVKSEVVDPPGAVDRLPADQCVLMGEWPVTCRCWVN